MGWRFRRSVKVLPGVRLNLSKSGLSTTIGVRGASVNIGNRGSYLNVGLPGTGLSYRQRIGSTQTSAPPVAVTPAPPSTIPSTPAVVAPTGMNTKAAPNTESKIWLSIAVVLIIFGFVKWRSDYQDSGRISSGTATSPLPSSTSSAVIPASATPEAPSVPTTPKADSGKSEKKPPPGNDLLLTEAPSVPTAPEADSGKSEEKPPPGNDLLLTEAQLRWCLYQSVRLDAATATIRNQSADNTILLNQMIGEWNDRCARYRYNINERTAVEAEVNNDKVRLQMEGWQLSTAVPTTSTPQASMPDNAQADQSAQGWTCSHGYFQLENRCESVTIPPNALIHSYDNGWSCQWGFFQSGRQCLPVVVPQN
jgi:hypothetical protein